MELSMDDTTTKKRAAPYVQPPNALLPPTLTSTLHLLPASTPCPIRMRSLHVCPCCRRGPRHRSGAYTPCSCSALRRLVARRGELNASMRMLRQAVGEAKPKRRLSELSVGDAGSCATSSTWCAFSWVWSHSGGWGHGAMVPPPLIRST